MLVWRARVRKRFASSLKQGIWWRAICSTPIRKVRRAIKNGDVGGVFLDSVAELQETNEVYWDTPVIFVKMREPTDRTLKAGLDLCLSEMGIGLLDPIP
jgi:hypothetical protein